MKYTQQQIAEQQERVNKAPTGLLYYERGKLDCMLGNVVPPPGSRIERLQWLTGWDDQYNGVGT